MKKVRKLVKLMAPGWFMHWWLPYRYGINPKPASDSIAARVMVALAPYAVSAILQQRVETDKRSGKYFLPYGIMCKRMLRVYGKDVGNIERDKGFIGMVRASFPYGLVLWWDREDARLDAEVRQQAQRKAQAARVPSAATADALQKSLQQMRIWQDRQEVLSLRTLVGGAVPSVSVVLTGNPEAKDLKGSLERLCRSSIRYIEVIVAVPDAEARLEEAEVRARRGVRIVPLEAGCQPLHSVRNSALALATGDYVSFLEVGDYYATSDTLEWMVLTAKAEDAEIAGGKVAVNWKSARDGISGNIFGMSWLRSSGLCFVADDKLNDDIFLCCARTLAGHVLQFDRATVNHVPVAGDLHLTSRERKEDVLYALARTSRMAKHCASAELSEEVRQMILRKVAALREVVWNGSAVSGAKAELVRELARDIELPELADELLNPLVSVVVPAYNVERYLSRCLNSLAAQTLSAIEIIVVDDGSTDSTPSIADRYVAQNARIKVVHRQNGGLSAARNSGMENATGKYIGFVDGDDYVDPVMFSKLSAVLEGDADAELAVCGAKVEFSYAASEKDVAYAQKYFDLPGEGGFDLTLSLVHDITSSVCTKLYRRKFLEENRIRFPEGMENEDEVFFFFTMGKAQRIQIVDKPFYHYVRNDCGIMARQAEEFDSEGTLPDSLAKAFPLVAEYLKVDDRRDLLGVFFRHVCGAASRYRSDLARARISQILHSVGFFYYREFLDARDLGWVDNQLTACHNYDFFDAPTLYVDGKLFPALRSRVEAEIDPVFTFVVPVFNQERYLAFCLESLRRQTEQNIEIICVDDGSTDHSWRLLEQYAAIDGRVRIFHQENQGVSVARNFALDHARGRYVAFVDADDYVEQSMAKSISVKMDRDRLDVCLIDFACFDYRTRKSVSHYWELRNHRSAHPTAPVFSCEDIPNDISFFGGAAGSVWSREFLNGNGLRFLRLVNNEDLMFSMTAWIRARRMGIAMVPYYHYRRGNPSSAVSNRASGAGDETVISSLREMASLWERVRKGCNNHVIELVAKRILVEVVYYGSTRRKVLEFLQAEGFDMFGFDGLHPVEPIPDIWRRYDELRAQPCVAEERATGGAVAIRHMPAAARRIAERIERGRATSKKDLYIVTGQLNSTENEPIDSWMFFKWLQSHGVPSRYVMWKKHKMYAKLKASGELKDVILLSGDGCADFEFLEKCEDALVRCKIVAQENGALNSWLRVWLYFLPDCQYTFMEHGIKFLKHSASLGRYFATFNVINNSSTLEKDLLESLLPGHYETGVKPTCIVGGLPRLDFVKDEREPGRKERVVFVMFTWRATFNSGQEALEKSAYYRGIRALMSDANLRRLEALGVKIVLAAHHHLVNRVKHLSFGDSVKIVPQEEIAYWKGHADCCLTDYSSISFDFLFLGKPVIYWIPDREDALLLPDDYAEIVEAEQRGKSIFNVADSPSAVIDMIEHYAGIGFELEPEKRKIADKFFAYKTELSRHLYEALEKTD